MFEIYKYKTIDSTNTEAKRLLQKAEADHDCFVMPAIVVADEQTAGRGRQGKIFYSPAGTGLYMSIVDEFPADESEAALITVRTSIAVSDAIFECTGIMPGIKWVNDLYVDNLKVCGILAESVLVGGKRYVIIGIGVNISTEIFPTEISRIAGSLGVNSTDVEEMKHKLCAKIAQKVLSIKSGAYRELTAYRERSVVLGKMVEYVKNGKTQKGIAIEITENGGLAVKLEDGSRDLLQSGEISLAKWGSAL